jgi:hypothetical protein
MARAVAAREVRRASLRQRGSPPGRARPLARSVWSVRAQPPPLARPGSPCPCCLVAAHLLNGIRTEGQARSADRRCAAFVRGAHSFFPSRIQKPLQGRPASSEGRPTGPACAARRARARARAPPRRTAGGARAIDCLYACQGARPPVRAHNCMRALAAGAAPPQPRGGSARHCPTPGELPLNRPPSRFVDQNRSGYPSRRPNQDCLHARCRLRMPCCASEAATPCRCARQAPVPAPLLSALRARALPAAGALALPGFVERF